MQVSASDRSGFSKTAIEDYIRELIGRSRSKTAAAGVARK
jgi:hypothetical protein